MNIKNITIIYLGISSELKTFEKFETNSAIDQVNGFN